MKMKSLLLLILCYSVTISGQTEKGNFNFNVNSNLGLSILNSNTSGSGNINSNSVNLNGTGFSSFPSNFEKENSYNNFRLSFESGYFIFKDFVVGLGFLVSSSKETIETETSLATGNNSLESQYKNEEKIGSQNVYLFAKYYFLKGKFKPFFNVNVGLGKKKENTFNESVRYLPSVIAEKTILEKNYNNRFFNLGGGIAYFLNKSFSLELQINYTKSEETIEENLEFFFSDKEITKVNIGIGIGIFI
jgi:hypothetical protein